VYKHPVGGGVLQHVAHSVWGSGKTAPPSTEVISNQQAPRQIPRHPPDWWQRGTVRRSVAMPQKTQNPCPAGTFTIHNKHVGTAYRPNDNAHGGCLLPGPLILDLGTHSYQTPCTVHISAASGTVISAITRVPVPPVGYAGEKTAVG